MAKKKIKNNTQLIKQQKRRKFIIAAAIILIIAAIAALSVFLVGYFGGAEQAGKYEDKINQLKSEVLTDELRAKLGDSPAVGVNHAVFISVCDTAERAHIYTGTGDTVDEAWENADAEAEAGVRNGQIDPVWVKADVVYTSKEISYSDLSKEVLAARSEFYRWGLAFDGDYNTALLEAELNGAKIYEYDNGGIDFSYLNTYLEKAGREKLTVKPNNYIKFQCYGWMLDEDGTVNELYSDGLEYGRRMVDTVDDAYIEELLSNATEFLLEQVNEDGSFIYGMYPRFDNDLEGYNILRHATTIWSLICRYRMEPSEELQATIEKTFDYLISQVIYSDENTAYLYEKSADEIKLGGNSVMIIAMTEYMDVFQNTKYQDICKKLGNGILTMLNTETGEYYHVLNGDFTRKEEFRTVYYDGEATFALCRLYSLTKEQNWLDAACSAVDHFIEAEYEQHKDHWVAYSMNEITKHVDKQEYYEFALRNIQSNLKTIYDRDTTYHTYLEFLMVSFETYDRMIQKGIAVDAVDLEMFMKTIHKRAFRMLDGYFYPEYAMYMKNPQRILDTFMVRHDGYRVRIDDVQHNIGGYYLYFKNYDKLVDYGLLEYKD